MPPRHDKNQGLQRYADGQWGIDAYIAGRRHRQKIGGKEAARQALADLKRLAAEGHAPKAKRLTIGQWIEEWYLDTPRSPADTLYINKWRESIGSLYPEQWTVDQLRKWAHSQLEGGLKVASIHRQMDPLRTVYAEMVRRGEIRPDQNPMADRKALRLPKANNKRDAYLKQEDAPAAARELGKYWPYAEFAILTGMRLANLAQLRRENIDWRTKAAKLECTKNGEKFWVQLSGRALEIVKAQMASHEHDRIFPGPGGKELNKDWFRRRVWAPAFARAGITDLTWHDLRHTFATWLTQAQVDLYTVQALCNHQDHTTTQRYAHHADESARSAVERLAAVMAQATNQAGTVHKPSIALEKSGQNWIVLKGTNPALVAFSAN